MKQPSLTGIILVVLVLATGLGGCAAKSPPNQGKSDVKPPITADNRLVPLTLPPTAKVILQQGEPKSGRLMSIEPHKQQITLFSGRNSLVAIAEIDKLVFEGEVILRGKEIVIRGEEKSSGSGQETWSEPLTNFKVRDGSKGEAEINLKSLSKDKWEGIQSVAQDSSYVVEEMQFQSPQMLTVRVTPH